MSLKLALDKQKFYKDVGAQIASRRQDLGYTPEQLAKVMCCSVKDILRIEDGIIDGSINQEDLVKEILIYIDNIERMRAGEIGKHLKLVK